MPALDENDGEPDEVMDGEWRYGGHNIPEPVIRRRFVSGLRNFEELYKPLVDEWALYDNSRGEPILIEKGAKS